MLGGERRDPAADVDDAPGRPLPARISRSCVQEKGSFLDLVYDSDAAAEITLQPLKRFPELDAAILFSDILIVPFAIGQNLTFVAGEGPRLTPPLASSATRPADGLSGAARPDLRDGRARSKRRSAPAKTLIGFAGSPWTVATYMVAGQGSREQAEARRLAYGDPQRVRRDHRADRRRHARLSVGAGRGGRGGVAIVRQLGGQPVAGAIRAMGDRADRAAGRRAQAAPSRRSRHRLSQGCRRQARAPMRARPASTRIGLDETVDPVWAAQELPEELAAAGQSRPAGADRRRRSPGDRRAAHP